MRINKKADREIVDRIEAALDAIGYLDRVPFHNKREAAEMAAQTVLTYLREAVE